MNLITTNIVVFINFLAGILSVFAFAPFDFSYLIFISIGIFYYSLNQTQNNKDNFKLSFAFAFGLFGFGASWIYESIAVFGGANFLLASFITLLWVLALSLVYFSWFAYLYHKLKTKNDFLNCFVFASLFVMAEFFRTWFLTGFPWLLLGYTQTNSFLNKLAPVFGVYSISFIITLIASLFVCLYQAQQITRKQVLITLIALILCFFVLPTYQTNKQEQLTVELSQPNISLFDKFDYEFLQPQLDLFSSTIINSKADLILFPETMLPTYANRLTNLYQILNNHLKQTKQVAIFGVPTRENDKYYNSINVLGEATGQYHKHKLVPFGEFVPFESVLRGIIAFFDLPMSNFSRGDDKQDNIQAFNENIATLICYEVVYADFAANQAQNASLMTTISNDAWFGDSIGPQQHLQMAQMRAIENNKYMLRSTNNGITAIIDPQGNIISQLEKDTQNTLKGEVYLQKTQTIFNKFGSKPLSTLCLLILVGVFIYKRKNIDF